MRKPRVKPVKYTPPLEARAIRAATLILGMRRYLINEAAHRFPQSEYLQQWEFRGERNAYIDALRAMKQTGLIGDFDLCNDTATLPPLEKGGGWCSCPRVSRYQCRR